jgi:type IV secretory pathway VirB10-like protein
MRSSTIIALLGATLAVASPLHQALHAKHAKKAYVYDIVTDIVYVTVTEGELPSTSSTPDTTVVVANTVYVNPVEQSTAAATTSSSVPPPPPPPSTTSEPPAPTTTQAPPPPPPAATTEAAPVAAPTQEAAAVVEAPASSPTASSDPFISAAVSNHDSCRSSHSAGGVTYNETLAQFAAITAATCVFAHDL